jgi:hypothetical protein
MHTSSSASPSTVKFSPRGCPAIGQTLPGCRCEDFHYRFNFKVQAPYGAKQGSSQTGYEPPTRILLPLMQRLGRVIAKDNEALSLHALGGKTGRRDVALIWEESLPLSNHLRTWSV